MTSWSVGLVFGALIVVTVASGSVLGADLSADVVVALGRLARRALILLSFELRTVNPPLLRVNRSSRVPRSVRE